MSLLNLEVAYWAKRAPANTPAGDDLCNTLDSYRIGDYVYTLWKPTQIISGSEGTLNYFNVDKYAVARFFKLPGETCVVAEVPPRLRTLPAFCMSVSLVDAMVPEGPTPPAIGSEMLRNRWIMPGAIWTEKDDGFMISHVPDREHCFTVVVAQPGGTLVKVAEGVATPTYGKSTFEAHVFSTASALPPPIIRVESHYAMY